MANPPSIPVAANPTSPRDFDFSQVFFSQALRAAQQAQQYAQQAQAEQTGSERRAREREAVGQVIVLTQAAVEGYINWTLIRAGVTAGGNSFNQHRDAFPDAVKVLAPKTPAFAWSSENKSFFLLLNRWRNFLGHSDEKARENLAKHLASLGEVGPGAADSELVVLLTTELAERIISGARAAFDNARSALGTAPSATGAWVPLDEQGTPSLENPVTLRAVLRISLKQAGEVRFTETELASEAQLQASAGQGLRLAPGAAGDGTQWSVSVAGE
ncbi:hypothetical protein ACIPW5_33895 [Streptomyces sp. NPDC090077]|uniref:hypothetical protein n=1 Tax=Streptomyces sp. NPDC090077 TaxID=3365938 RepID=UPI0037F3D51C